MHNSRSRIFLALILSSASLTCSAQNLLQVYQDALANDQTYQQAISTWQSAKQTLPIARSVYLPLIEAQYEYSEKTQSSANSDDNVDTSNGTIGISQQIFNAEGWMAIKEANYSVKAATASYFAAQQNLIERTASAYFNVMIAAETVTYDKAYKRQLYNQLETNRQKYKVGLISSVDVFTTEASYDAQVAQEIADQNTLRDNIEALAVITNHRYKTLQGIKESIPLMTPKPNNLDQWVELAIKQNYTLQSQQYTTLAAKQDIKTQAGAAVPNIFGSAAAARNESVGNGKSKNSTIASLTIDYKPFQGGLVLANTRQSRYNYVTETGALEYQYRETVQNTRNSFLGVIANISKVKADQQGVISSEKSLQATQAGYQVGTEDIEDVLSSISQLYSSKQLHVSDQYAYMNQLIDLQESAGTLSVTSLRTINAWLQKPVTFSTLLDDSKYSTSSKETPSNTNNAITTNYKVTKNSTKPINNGNYTVQLYAAKQLKDANQFLAQINQPQAFIIQSKNGYKVVYGHFITSNAAKTTLKSLKPTFKDAWITQISTTPSKKIIAASKKPTQRDVVLPRPLA